MQPGVRAPFCAALGEVPLILRVGAGGKVIRGAQEATVPAGHLTLMPAHLALEAENHPTGTGPYCDAGLLVAPGIVAPTGTSAATADHRALAGFDGAEPLPPPAPPGVSGCIRALD